MYQRQIPFGEAIARAFSNYCNFTGRASRSEFWWFMLFYGLIYCVVDLIGNIIGVPTTNSFPSTATGGQKIAIILEWITIVVFLLPTLGLFWRRLHDTGRAGGYYFIILIPIVGSIILIVWTCQPSQPFPNRFGEEPNIVE